MNDASLVPELRIVPARDLGFGVWEGEAFVAAFDSADALAQWISHRLAPAKAATAADDDFPRVTRQSQPEPRARGLFGRQT